MWVDPVFDRTESDIQNETKVAFRDSDTLNRLEGNTDILAGYLGISVASKTWKYTDFPTVKQMNRVVDNIHTVRDEFYNNFLIAWYYFDLLGYTWAAADTANWTWADMDCFLDKCYLPQAPGMPFLHFEPLNTAELILHYIYTVGGVVWLSS